MLQTNRNRRGRTAAWLAGLLLMATAAHGQTILYVDDDAALGGDGLTWNTAFKYLQDTLATASASGGTVTEIHVAQGTYTPDQDEAGNVTSGDRAVTLQLVNGVTVYGGYAGPGAPDPDEHDVQLYVSTLSGDLNSDDGPISFAEFASCFTKGDTSYEPGCEQFDFNTDGYVHHDDRVVFVLANNYDDNSYHVVSGSGTDQTAVLQGFAVTAGNSDGPDYLITDTGAGMFNDAGSPAVTECVFTANSAYFGGGVANMTGSSPTFVDCKVIQNWAEYGGGMLNLDFSGPTLTRCAFTGNIAYDGDGGAIQNWNASNPTLIDSTFAANSAAKGGGIANSYFCDTVFINCAFLGNSASGYTYTEGGGMYNVLSSAVLTNCAFTGNFSAGDGGGILSDESSVALTNCTFSRNSAYYSGGGVVGKYNSAIFIGNCIFWENTYRDGFYMDQPAQVFNEPGDPLVVNYSCVHGWTGSLGGTGNTGQNPTFVDPDGDDNIDGTEDDNLHLSGASPCIESGDNAALPPDDHDLDGDGNTTEQIPWDLAGNPRVVDGLVDMGAYEGPNQSLVVAGVPVTVPEGATATFSVSLATDPFGTMDVAVAPLGGDADITVQTGSALVFDSSNFANPQSVTLAAAEDSDFMDGTTTIRVTPSGMLPSDVPVDLTALEADNDPPTAQPVLYVDLHATGIDNGTSWPDALTDLQAALFAAANSGGVVQEIWVARGAYTPAPPNGDRLATFQLLSGVALFGGFAGGETSLDQRDPVVNETILSGDLNGDDEDTPWCSSPGSPPRPDWPNNSENSYRVVTGSGTDATGRIDGFTVSGGNASSPVIDSGAGLYIYGGSPTISNCVFTKNSAPGAAGIHVEYYTSIPSIVNCKFYRNSASGLSLSYAGHVNVVSCSFTENYSTGLGIVNNNPWGATVRNCTFERNCGRGLSVNGLNVTVTVVDCTFDGNHNSALANTRSNLTVVSSLFANNTASHSGGAITNTLYGTAMVIGCTFVGNEAGSFGGAVEAGGENVTLINCIFRDNLAHHGGALAVSSELLVSNCTLTGNMADSVTGKGGGVYSVAGADVTLANTILWGNTAAQGREMALSSASEVLPTVYVSYSDVLGGLAEVHRELDSVLTWGDGIIELDPLLTPDGHLLAGSPCLDAGSNGAVPNDIADINSNGVTAEPIPYDIDGPPEMRISGDTVDMGADEFQDADTDGLPDWCEAAWPTASEPGLDADSDGLTNLEEYEQYSSNPVGAPIYVCDACDPAPDGTLAHPYGTIQAGINAAGDGDTVLVLAGTYTGTGNFDLDYGGKSVVVRAVDPAGPAATEIDTGGAGRAVNLDSITGTFAVLEGFTIRGGEATLGEGVRTDRSRLMLKDCILTGNNGPADGGGFYAALGMPTIDGLTIGTNPAVDAGTIADSNVNLRGLMSVADGTLETRASWFYGPGRIDLAGGTTLRVTGAAPGDPPSVIRSKVSGTGNIQIDIGHELRVENGAIVDLSGLEPQGTCGGCPTEDPSGWGTITVDGVLSVRNATVRNTNVDVTLAEFVGTTGIINNDIRLVEASTGFGGQFFVEGSSTIECNTITSEGDRYLDLDPDPDAAARPIICDNDFFVEIKQGANSTLGTILELRTEDFDCGTSGCYSGAIELAAGPGYSDTWVLEQLDILPDAKLNLTNRQGFVFQPPQVTTEEALYVKNLVLHPNAVLNTALQRLYYQDLLDENGLPLVRDPQDPSAPLANGSRFLDIPLLGFSLGIIAMDDTTPPPANEFDIRVRTRLRDPNDTQPCLCLGTCGGPNPTACLEGSVERLPEADVQLEIPTLDTGGVMDMRTQASGHPSASSVAAKGAFARAGDEDIVITFEYLFLENPNAELVVYLSDEPDVGDNIIEVARVQPPASGRPGSIGSNQLGIFWGEFPRGPLNFHRGTYVELELVGANSRIWIDNWDPQISCGLVCSDLNDSTTVDNGDFLLALAEFGQGIDLDSPKYCLDNGLSGDLYVDLGDLLSWDTFLNGSVLNACGRGGLPGELRMGPPAPVVLPPDPALLIAGKSDQGGVQADYVYTTDTTGSCPEPKQDPPAGPDSRSNGRLIQDGQGNFYQLHGSLGLLDLGTASTAFQPGSQVFQGDTVYVGVNELGGGSGDFQGLPLQDAAFDPAYNTILYVLPVVVFPQSGDLPYQAAAKLQLLGGGSFDIQQLYGKNPATDPDVTVSTSQYGDILYEPDKQHLRELELDDSAQTVFVVGAHALNDNDWVLIYDQAAGNASEEAVCVTGTVAAPTAMLVSSYEPNKLYLASSVNADTTTELYRFTIEVPGSQPRLTYDYAIDIDNTDATTNGMGFGFMTTITSIGEDPLAGTLYATGFAMALFNPETHWSDPAFDAVTGSIFTVPTLTIVPAGATGPLTAAQLDCHDLALPVSLVFHPGDCATPGDFDANDDGYVDLEDYAGFQRCFGNSGSLPAECLDFDSNCDSTIDLTDYVGFHGAITGP